MLKSPVLHLALAFLSLIAITCTEYGVRNRRLHVQRRLSDPITCCSAHKTLHIVKILRALDVSTCMEHGVPKM